MGSTRPARELARARIEYVATARELMRAMTAFDAAGVPIVPTRGGALAPWTGDHVQVVLRVRDAWVRFADARRTYDTLARQPSQR